MTADGGDDREMVYGVWSTRVHAGIRNPLYILVLSVPRHLPGPFVSVHCLMNVMRGGVAPS